MLKTTNYQLIKHSIDTINIVLKVTYPNSLKPINFIIEKNFSIGYVNITIVSVIKKVS